METEKTNLVTCRELVQALNVKIGQLENATSPLQEEQPDMSCLLTAKDKQISDLSTQLSSLQEQQEEKDRQIRELTEEIEQLRSDNIDLENVRSLLDAQLSTESDRPAVSDRNVRTKSLTETPRPSSVFSSLWRSRSSQASNPSPEPTPPIVPIANPTGKSATRIVLSPGVTLNIVKLKMLPSPNEHITKQVVCRVDKKYQLGILMVLFEAPNLTNRRIVAASYAGVQLYSHAGDCDGVFREKRFFECDQNCGIFVPYQDVLVPVL